MGPKVKDGTLDLFASVSALPASGNSDGLSDADAVGAAGVEAAVVEEDGVGLLLSATTGLASEALAGFSAAVDSPLVLAGVVADLLSVAIGRCVLRD